MAIFGVTIGWAAATIVKWQSDQPGPALLMLSITGALVGGALGKLITSSPASSPSIFSLIIAIVGAISLIQMYRNISPQS